MRRLPAIAVQGDPSNLAATRGRADVSRLRAVGLATLPLLALGWTASAEEAGGAAVGNHLATDQFGATVSSLLAWGEQTAAPLIRWYYATPPLERLACGGLVACALLALVTLCNRLVVVRARRVIPDGYRERFHTRLLESRLDWRRASTIAS